MATAEQNTISTEELFANQAPQVAEPTITQPEAQTVSTAELFGGQDTSGTSVGISLNPQSDEKISTQQEEPISMAVANRIKDFFGYNDTTNKRFQTSYEISQSFGIPIEQAQDDRVYRNLVSDTFSTEKPLDRVSSELMSVSFMAAAGAGLVTAPIPTMKALAYFGVANEVVSLALSSKWDGLTPNLEDYDFSETRTLVDDVPKNSPPWLYAVAEVTDFLAKAGMVGGAMKAEAGFKGKIKKGVEDIFAKYKKPLALAEPKVAPKELPLATQETGMPKDTTKIPVSTKLQPEPAVPKEDPLGLIEPQPKPDVLKASVKDPLKVVAEDGMQNLPIPAERVRALQNTPLKGSKNSVEVRTKIASDLGISPQELANSGRGIGWTARWQSDGHLVDSHPIVEWGVKKLTEANIEAEENVLKFVKVNNELAKRARKGGRKRLTAKEDPTGVTTWQRDVRPGYRGGLWDKLVPTDDLIFDFLESPNKAELAKTMTPEELEYALFTKVALERLYDLVYEAEKIQSHLDNYVTHIRRNFAEAWKTTGNLGVAFKETRKNFMHDLARFKVRDKKTGKRVPFEVSFKYSQERTGKAIPTKNIAKINTQYHETVERMLAYNKVIPAMLEGIKAIKPVEPTYMEEHAYKMLETFVKQWAQNKRGVPADFAIDPQSEFAFWLKSARTFVSIMDLGLNPIIGTAAAVGEGSMNYMALGPKKVALGFERGLTPQGKEILNKYQSWIGRSPWSELADASHQITDSAMKTMFAFFQTSAVEANKHGLLGSITEAEFKSGEITTERLAEIRLGLNRYRYQKGMESVVENTVEGKFFGQYKFSWGMPPLVSSMKNASALINHLKGGKKLNDSQKFELRRAAEMLLFGVLIAKLYYPDNDDKSVSANARRKIGRESLTQLGALQMLLSPGASRLAGLELNIATGVYETLKGMLSNSPDTIESGLKKLKNIAVPSVIKQGMDVFTSEKIKPPSKKRGAQKDADPISAFDILEATAPKQR